MPPPNEKKDLDSLASISLPPVPNLSGRNLGRSLSSSGAGSEATRKQKAGLSATGLIEIRIKCRDGRLCTLCGMRDSSLDPVKGEQPVFWFYPPRNYRDNKNPDAKDDWRPEGKLDVYCGKVFKHLFRSRYATPELLKAEFGVNPEEHDVFKAPMSIRLCV
jgi:hypothetical protein